MLQLLRHLSPEDQRELIALLAPARRADLLSGAELFDELLDVLRKTLQVPDDADLPMYLRRRLVDVSGWFGIDENTSIRTDLELARAISEFAFRGADEMQTSDELRAHFETFFRTKRKDERDAFLSSVARLQSVRDAGEVAEVEQVKGGQAVADALLSGLSSASARPSRRARTRARASAQLTSQSPKVAAALSGATAAGMTPAAAGMTLALPLSAVAGGLYMARLGLKQNKLQRIDENATRGSRARNSKLVQNVVALSAFLVASADARY